MKKIILIALFAIATPVAINAAPANIAVEQTEQITRLETEILTAAAPLLGVTYTELLAEYEAGTCIIEELGGLLYKVTAGAGTAILDLIEST